MAVVGKQNLATVSDDVEIREGFQLLKYRGSSWKFKAFSRLKKVRRERYRP